MLVGAGLLADVGDGGDGALGRRGSAAGGSRRLAWDMGRGGGGRLVVLGRLRLEAVALLALAMLAVGSAPRVDVVAPLAELEALHGAGESRLLEAR